MITFTTIFDWLEDLVLSYGLPTLGVIAVIGLFLLVGNGIRKMWPFITQAVTIGNALLALPAMQEDMKTVKHEVLPNNGGSFRDDLATLQTGFTEMSGVLDKHITDDGARLKKVEGSLRSLHRKVKPIEQASVIENTLTPPELALLKVRAKKNP